MSNQTYNIAVIRGDGIGVDVTEAALAVIEAARERVGGFGFRYTDIAAGAAYYKETGDDIAPGGEEVAGALDAILLGAIGLPSIRHADGTEIAPHLRLRESMQLRVEGIEQMQRQRFQAHGQLWATELVGAVVAENQMLQM